MKELRKAYNFFGWYFGLYCALPQYHPQKLYTFLCSFDKITIFFSIITKNGLFLLNTQILPKFCQIFYTNPAVSNYKYIPIMDLPG